MNNVSINKPRVKNSLFSDDDCETSHLPLPNDSQLRFIIERWIMVGTVQIRAEISKLTAKIREDPK